MRRKAGQMTVEAVLIVTLLFVGVSLAVQLIQSNRILPRLVEEPWGYLAGMIENGVWAPPEAGAVRHPNHISRHGSPEGDAP